MNPKQSIQAVLAVVPAERLEQLLRRFGYFGTVDEAALVTAIAVHRERFFNPLVELYNTCYKPHPFSSIDGEKVATDATATPAGKSSALDWANFGAGVFGTGLNGFLQWYDTKTTAETAQVANSNALNFLPFLTNATNSGSSAVPSTLMYIGAAVAAVVVLVFLIRK